MKIKNIFAALFVMISILWGSASAFACACCAERGTYHVSTGKLASYELELLKEMKFGSGADLYLDAAGFDDFKGIADVVKEFQKTSSSELDLVDAFTGSAWTLNFMTEGEQKGSIVLPRPTQMTSRKVDIPDNTSTSPNVVLYKEWIFNGSVRSGSGFFRRDIVNPATKYSLIFQGHGNNCDNAEDFKNWRLSIKGPKADYVFFGKMKAAAASTAQLDTLF